MIFGKRTILALSIFLPAILAASAPPCPMETRSFEFTYSMRVTDLPEQIGKIAIWLPYPVSDDNQSISEVSVSAPFSHSIHRDPDFQNSILYLSAEDPEVSSIEIEMVFRVNRKEFLRKDFSAGRPAGSEDLSSEVARWLEPDRLVPLDDFIRALAEKVTEGKSTDLEKARAIYDYAVTSMVYDKSGEGWAGATFTMPATSRRGTAPIFTPCSSAWPGRSASRRNLPSDSPCRRSGVRVGSADTTAGPSSTCRDMAGSRWTPPRRTNIPNFTNTSSGPTTRTGCSSPTAAI